VAGDGQLGAEAQRSASMVGNAGSGGGVDVGADGPAQAWSQAGGGAARRAAVASGGGGMTRRWPGRQ
jgi:hypothetical protein